MKMKKIEDLITALRRYDFTLDLTSTLWGSKTKYSAIFWNIYDKECQKCASHIPNAWDVYEHANTIKDAIRLAASDIVDSQGLDINLEDYE